MLRFCSTFYTKLSTGGHLEIKKNKIKHNKKEKRTQLYEREGVEN